MTNDTSNKLIWFIYDGECPLCKAAALALRIKEDYGPLHLLNAREDKEHALIREINLHGLDLDQGMVIYDGREFFHGKDALQFMARYGDASGLFNLTNKALYQSDTLTKLMYPWMRGVRNILLRFKGVAPIDNLSLKEEPIFKSVFGDVWDELPKVMQKHYGNRPYSSDITTVEGTLDVMCKPPLKYLSPCLLYTSPSPRDRG